MVKCDFCGEKRGTELINDPNGGSVELWKVCKECKVYISEMQTKALQAFMGLAINELKNEKKPNILRGNSKA